MKDIKPKVGKPGALKSITKKLTEIRKKPLSKKVYEIVEQSSDEFNKGRKIAKSSNDLGV